MFPEEGGWPLGRHPRPSLPGMWSPDLVSHPKGRSGRHLCSDRIAKPVGQGGLVPPTCRALWSRRSAASARETLAIGRPRCQLAEAVQRGKIRPEPPVVAGRRLWDSTTIAQAAEHFSISREQLGGRRAQAAASGEEV